MDLKKYAKHHMTVGDLLDFIENNNIPREGKILVQRVEDAYFEVLGWETLKRKDGEVSGEYIPAFTTVKYKQDITNLYLDCHY